MCTLPGQGIKPMIPALAGRFLSTVPPGKSSTWNIFNINITYIKWNETYEKWKSSFVWQEMERFPECYSVFLENQIVKLYMHHDTMQYLKKKPTPTPLTIRKDSQQTTSSPKLRVVELKSNREKEIFTLYNLFWFEFIMSMSYFWRTRNKNKQILQGISSCSINWVVQVTNDPEVL